MPDRISLRARHRLGKFFLRHGVRPPQEVKKSWTKKHMDWVEAAWAYQHKPWMGGWLAKRQQGLDEEIKAIAWKAQWRLCTRYKKLAARGKNKPQIVTAIGRELLGFIWAMAVRTEARAAAHRA